MESNFAYVPHYSDKTFLTCGTLPNGDDILARSKAIRQYKIRCIGEVWLQHSGYVPVYYGPLVDIDTRDLLCLRLYLDDLSKINNGQGPFSLEN